MHDDDPNNYLNRRARYIDRYFEKMPTARASPLRNSIVASEEESSYIIKLHVGNLSFFFFHFIDLQPHPKWKSF